MKDSISKNVIDFSVGERRNIQMEREVELRVGEIIKRYRLHKYICCAIVVLDVIFLFYMVFFKMDSWFSYYVGGFASFC